MKKVCHLACRFDQLLSKVPLFLMALAARIAVAHVFWKSAQTRISGGEFMGQKWQFYNLNETAFFLFEHEFALPLIPSDVAAYMGTVGEFFLAIFLVLGIATRFSALALLGMTAVMQFWVYPHAWGPHLLWAASLLYLMRYGAGAVSIDAILSRRCPGQK